MSGSSSMGGSSSQAGSGNQAGSKAGGSAGSATGGSMLGGESAGGATAMAEGGAGATTAGDGSGGESAAGSGNTGEAGMAGSDGVGSQTITLDGAAAKGPFINGSSVSVTPVDGAGNPNGNTFPTQTQDDVGNFSLQFAYQGAVQLDATGQWYNEVTGQTEESPLTLHGLAAVSAAGTQHAYINVATHLTYLRVKKLMAGGASLDDATAQAETELRAQLQLGGTGFNPNASATGLNLLGGDTDQAAYIFALGSVSLLGAQAANNVTEQQFLNNVQSTFQTAGVVGASYVTAFNKAMPFIEPDYVMRQLAAYFEQVGFAGTVPNINRALDTDKDGVGNLTDTCLLQPNANQDPVRGLCTYEQKLLPQAQGFSYGSAFPVSGDLDHDGDQDLVKVLLPTSEVLSNDGDGNFTRTTFDLAAAMGVSVNNPSVVIVSAALGKIDADNAPDLLVGVIPNGGQQAVYSSLYLFPGNGDGTFGSKQTIWSSEPQGCVPGGQPCTPGVTTCCGGECMPTGPSTYACMASFQFTPSFTQIHLVDVNGDNKLDIVAGRAGNTGVNNKSLLASVILNLGAGSWAAPKDIKVTGADNQSVNAYGLGVGNFTADSNPDILVLVSAPNGGAGLAPQGLYLATGDGAGNFALSGPTSTASGCDTSMAVGDFDEDTKLDVAFLDVNGTKLTLAFGVGDGTFTAAVSSDVNSVPTLNGPGNGGGGSCPYVNGQNKPGLGTGLQLAAGPYTGGAHTDLASQQSIFVSNGRSAPKQQFLYFQSSGGSVGPAKQGAGPLPADSDFNGDGATDSVLSSPASVVLTNPPGYHSF